MTICFSNVHEATEIYSLSLHDALPISTASAAVLAAMTDNPLEQIVGYGTGIEPERLPHKQAVIAQAIQVKDRKSTRLNSSHVAISYAVFCLKKKTRVTYRTTLT